MNLTEEDFHQRKTDNPVRITVAFTDLSADAQEDFRDYYRQGKLIVSAEAHFDKTGGTAVVKQFGNRLGMGVFKPFFAAHGDGKLVAELRDQYAKMRQHVPALPDAKTKDAMFEALRAYEVANPNNCVEIPSEDQFYGVSRGANRLAKYIQWVYIPAVKDASEEQAEGKTTALGKLLARTVRSKVDFVGDLAALQARTLEEYDKLIDKQQGALKEIETTLSAGIAMWAHPGAKLRLEWAFDQRKAVQLAEPAAKAIAGEGLFEGDLARFGHGFQRSYLLALLQVLAGGGGDANAPRLILGCEEPELYQHPPQARYLADVLRRLSEGNAQILIATHSPLFVSGESFEMVRMVRNSEKTNCSSVRQFTFAELADGIAKAKGEPPKKPAGILAKLHQALQPSLSELFFANRLVLVEGIEDVAYITAWLVLSDRMQAFRAAGLHVVPVQGKSQLPQAIVLARGLGIPTYVVFDADGDDAKNVAAHEKDNKVLLTIVGGDPAMPFPAADIVEQAYATWRTNIAASVWGGLDPVKVQEWRDKASVAYGHAGDLDKNGLHIAERLRLAFDEGVRPPVLDAVCERILALQ